MRADAARADRHHEVQKAARSWRRAGAIDDATLAAIEAAYPDDRRRLGPVFRIVAFGFGVFALLAFSGMTMLLTHGAGSLAVACLVIAGGLAGATEVLVGPFRRADSGIESATSLMAFTFAVVGCGAAASRLLSDGAVITVLALMAAAWAVLGSVRWGSWLLALLGGCALLLFLARLPMGRLLWIAVAVTAAPVLLRGSEARRLPPAHRRSLLLTLLLSICALYTAVHLGSWDGRILEEVGGFGRSREALPWARPLSILATACVPLAVLAFGAATRRAVLVALGIVLGVVSLVTLRFYVHVAPLWIVLVASGSAALLASLGVRRWLVSGPGRERHGYTAEPLYEEPGRRHAAEVLGALAAVAPAAHAPASDGTLKPGGGRFGGGGASGEF